MKKTILLMMLLLLTACEEKRKPVISVDTNVQLPLTCLKLNPLESEENFEATLKNLYTFKANCPHQLTLSYKKDIVCNSGYNASGQSLGKFPRSFLKLEVRKGFRVEYSYYIDLLDNVESDEVEEGFVRLKKDILMASEGQK
ncbi:MAG: hypothetical protein DSZ07_03630 [Sulfurovum sp.]|nr:MAG: hypothetical protein DSZ07_03630 [Sulfurovum sp.]